MYNTRIYIAREAWLCVYVDVFIHDVDVYKNYVDICVHVYKYVFAYDVDIYIYYVDSYVYTYMRIITHIQV